ncbi:hypothetical protein DOTSEDRAFT_74319 [Dothistroma septosporum NZE10]|uniref:Uncharacterized protein n=1 Tax=Dothistroma septosporum (strain NZE10 / CBS 128990) TaxID=675120 RepID=N1PGU1_DOTSN|nr:hypothetical protein DOTSEDRAFT_74319 [Dothistroma septosporum NZE10]
MMKRVPVEFVVTTSKGESSLQHMQMPANPGAPLWVLAPNANATKRGSKLDISRISSTSPEIWTMARFDEVHAHNVLLQSIAASFNKSSTFSHLSLTCGNQRILCHDSILTQRLKWFEGTFDGRFQAKAMSSSSERKLTSDTGGRQRHRRAT